MNCTPEPAYSTFRRKERQAPARMRSRDNSANGNTTLLKKARFFASSLGDGGDNTRVPTRRILRARNVNPRGIKARRGK